MVSADWCTQRRQGLWEINEPVKKKNMGKSNQVCETVEGFSMEHDLRIGCKA